MVPRNAYVEDVPDVESGAVAIVDAPPRAPSPPSAGVNVFDFLVPDDGSTKQRNDASKALPSPDDSKLLEDGGREDEKDIWYDVEELAPEDPMQYEQHDYREYMETGYEYGNAPLIPSFERYDSYHRLPSASRRHAEYTTPGPRREVSARGHSHKESKDSTTKKSGKRKRGQPDEIDVSATKALQPVIAPNGDVVMTDVPPALHSGLTGGLNKLMFNRNSNGFPFPPSPDFSGEGEGVEGSPLSPIKKPKHVSIVERKPEKERGRDTKAKPVLKRKAPTSHVRMGFSTQSIRRDRDPHSPSRDPDQERDGSGERRRRRRRHRRSESPDGHREHRSGQHRQLKAIEYTPRSSSPGANDSNALIRRDPGTVALRTEVTAHARAELFMSFVTKGPESERGCSVNKALKRYHRERTGEDDDDAEDGRRDSGIGGSGRKRRREERERKAEEKVSEEKELWKSLRLRRNDRGEIVLFFGE